MRICGYRRMAAPFCRRLAGAVIAVVAALSAALPAVLYETPAVAQEGYTLTIDGTTYPIGLDRHKNIVLPDGSRVTLLLSQDAFTTYSTDAFSFSHESHYKPARTELADGLVQTIVVTPLGSGVVIQEYANIDPADLIDVMLNEVTKEEVGYGYEYEESEVSREVGDRLVRGRQAITTYDDEKWYRAVYAYGTGDSGLLIMTMIQEAFREQDAPLLDEFWRTLRIN